MGCLEWEQTKVEHHKTVFPNALTRNAIKLTSDWGTFMQASKQLGPSEHVIGYVSLGNPTVIFLPHTYCTNRTFSAKSKCFFSKEKKPKMLFVSNFYCTIRSHDGDKRRNNPHPTRNYSRY